MRTRTIRKRDGVMTRITETISQGIDALAAEVKNQLQPWDICIIPNCGCKREHVERHPKATPFCRYHYETVGRLVNR